MSSVLLIPSAVVRSVPRAKISAATLPRISGLRIVAMLDAELSPGTTEDSRFLSGRVGSLSPNHDGRTSPERSPCTGLSDEVGAPRRKSSNQKDKVGDNTVVGSKFTNTFAGARPLETSAGTYTTCTEEKDSF